jgi:uncharacterized protein (TIGR03084 family)
VDPVVSDLAAEHADLAHLLDRLSDDQWQATTPCDGWNVADVVVHLAQSDELAIASATGELSPTGAASQGFSNRSRSVDDVVDEMVKRERGLPAADLKRRWITSSGRLVRILDDMDLSKKVEWVAGTMSARSLATTRLAETWIHGGDIAEAVGIVRAPTDRLRAIARLAWRTLPYAFGSAGRSMEGPVALHLTAPSGVVWDFVPDEPAVTTITGSASDLCDVAGRRRSAGDTSLTGVGPDVAGVLTLIRTYA